MWSKNIKLKIVQVMSSERHRYMFYGLGESWFGGKHLLKIFLSIILEKVAAWAVWAFRK